MSIDREEERDIAVPFYLDVKDVVPEVARFKSVLIVPCRFCPAASMAVRSDEAYLEFPRRSFKTAAYERLVTALTRSLEARGIETTVFTSRWLHQFVLCMWTARRRKALLEQARRHEAVLVLGCEAAVETVRHAVESAGCEVLQGMTAEGIMSIQPTFSLPGNVRLGLESVTRYVYPDRSDGS